MSINLANYDEKAHEAIRRFWRNRDGSRRKQAESGKTDQGERAGVAAGKNMDGFIALVADYCPGKRPHRSQRTFRAPRRDTARLFPANETLGCSCDQSPPLGRRTGIQKPGCPSFGNNFNNRTEEAIGTAHDLWTAFREGAFGEQPRPFAGWLILVEDTEGSRMPVRDVSPHYAVFQEFEGASYADRYNILCRKLVQEQLYTVASVLLSPRSAAGSGEYAELSELTALRTFVTELAGHVAAEAAR